ncbi:hypothetical protein P8452_42326 [Trifolium repens]|nr:hypothetical protein P8452_42326 [Trifolium repens]
MQLSTVNTTAILPQIDFIPIDFIPKSQSILPQIDSTSHNPFSSNSKQRTIQLSASVLLKKRVHYKTVTNPSPIERNTIPVFLSTKRYSVLFRFYSRKIKLQDIIEKDGQPSSEVFQTLISAPTTDANSEFHSLTSTHAPNDNEMMNNDDINEDMQDFEDEE